jgi:hypothetical protein
LARSTSPCLRVRKKLAVAILFGLIVVTWAVAAAYLIG